MTSTGASARRTARFIIALQPLSWVSLPKKVDRVALQARSGRFCLLFYSGSVLNSDGGFGEKYKPFNE